MIEKIEEGKTYTYCGKATTVIRIDHKNGIVYASYGETKTQIAIGFLAFKRFAE